MKRLLSIFDYTGNWAKPWVDYDYEVHTVDIKAPPAEYQYDGRVAYAVDIFNWYYDVCRPDYFDIILAAPPCTDFALSGARHFAAKDADGRTDKSIALVLKTLEIIEYFRPRVWALENPMSRIHKLVPQLGSPSLKFHPYEYGAWVDPPEDRKKLTWLWGNFTIPEKRPIPCAPCDKNGFTDWYNKVGGASERTKEWRSQTPMGFAKAFAAAKYRNDI